MLVRKSRALALTAAVVVAVLGPSTSPAAAVDIYSTWATASVTCASGSINTYPVSGKVVTLKGWIKPCLSTPADADDFFAIGVYYWSGNVHLAETQFRTSYDSATGTTNFSVPVDFTGYTPALCLAYGKSKRLSCVNVSWVNGVATITPMSTTDPKVNLDLTEHLLGVVKCGSCW